MRENYLVFVVRPAGASWELLVLATPCGVDRDQFDVLRGRVPHDQDPDEVIRRDAAKYNLLLAERLATLGDEPLLESRRRTAYVYRAADNLPLSWSVHVMPDKQSRTPGFTFPDIVGHFRFLDLAQPIPIGNDEAAWLDQVRQTLGLKPLPQTTLAIWATDAPSDAAAAAKTLQADQQPSASRCANFTDLATQIRKHSGWTENPRMLILQPIGPTGPRGFGLLAHFHRDGQTFEETRTTVISLAGHNGCHTFDATASRLYRPNETPAPGRHGPSTHHQLLELRLTKELVAELARQAARPLMLWPLRPPVDQGGNDGFRDEGDELPQALWALPANQRQILDMKSFGYFDCNDGLVCPLVDDLAPLHAFDQRRVVTRPGGAVITYSYDQVAGWEQLVDHLGWAYLPNGPDTLWGDLHVSPRLQPLLEEVRNWCRRNGVQWSRYESRGEEVVRVVENAPNR